MAIYHIFGDHKNNEHRKEDLESAERLIVELEQLSEVEYGDRYGVKDFTTKTP